MREKHVCFVCFFAHYGLREPATSGVSVFAMRLREPATSGVTVFAMRLREPATSGVSVFAVRLRESQHPVCPFLQWRID